jgi:peptide/nickel transport system substrate-binding protein
VQSETPTCQILPPTMFGYTPYCPYTAHPNAASGAWHAPDPARADALVRSSGTRGDHVALWGCSCLGAPPAETRYVGHLLKSLGYRTDTHVTASFDAYVAGTSDTHSPVAIIEGWVSDFPYPSNFFDPLLMCSSPGPEPATTFCDPKLDRLVRSAKEAQGTAAVTLWQAADRDAVDQAAWAPLTNELGVDVIGAGVGNYQHNPQTGILLDQLWVR